MLGQAEVVRAAPVAGEGPKTWQDAVERWIVMHNHELKPSSQTRYAVSLRQLDAHFKGRLVATIRETDVNAYIAARMGKGTSGPTIRRDLAVMSRVMKVAKRAGWTQTNPVPDEKAEIKENRKVVRRLKTRRVAAAIRAARSCMTPTDKPHMPDLIRLIARTGCREMEAATLEWSDFDPQARTLAFRETKTGNPRVITLTPRCARWLAGLPRAPKPRTGPHYIFQDRNGGHLKQVAQRFQRIRERSAGQWWCDHHWTLHELRHNYGLWRLWHDERQDRTDDQPRGIYPLSLHLGHASVKTTEIYLRGFRLPAI